MKTYLAHIYYKIEIAPADNASYDLQLRIVQAENEEEALFEARKLALEDEISFINVNGQLVNWKLAGITELKEVNVQQHGELMASSTIERSESKDAEQFIRLKNHDLAVRIGKKELIFLR